MTEQETFSPESKEKLKPVRFATRLFLIEENKIACIQYSSGDKKGVYDLPGGKIEEGETALIGVLREVKEELDVEAIEPEEVGTLIVEYPERTFNLKIFVAHQHQGEIQETEENTSYWLPIDELIKKSNCLPSILLLQPEYRYLLSKKNFLMRIKVDTNSNLLSVEEIKA